jgi:hypothetical protein
MKIVDRITFLALPENTLYSKYEPCVFGPLEIKGETWGNDFLTQQIADSVDAAGTDELIDILFDAQEKGTSFDLDLEICGRDGLFEDDQLFAVWEHNDVVKLIERLQKILD